MSDRLDVTRQGRRVCERLAAEVGETVNVAVLQEQWAVNVDQAKRLKQLEDENGRLKKLVADLSLEKQVLRDIAQGKL